MSTEHPQTTLQITLQVDELIAPLVRDLWRLGCVTVASCQDPAYVSLCGKGTAFLLAQAVLDKFPQWGGSSENLDNHISVLGMSGLDAINEAVEALKGCQSLWEVYELAVQKDGSVAELLRRWE